jgi:plastocyanin
MTKTSRRNALKLAAAGSVATVLSAQHEHQSVHGRLANASVSFGQWKTDPPLDRFSPAPPAANGHQLIPDRVTIETGGVVNFVVAGFHNVQVYDDGVRPDDIDVTRLIGGLLIDDPTNRIYRGLDPREQPQDRVEVVQFSRPGTFLVICGVLSHFRGGMVGFVRVLREKEEN